LGYVILSDQRERRISIFVVEFNANKEIPRRFAPRNDISEQMSTEPSLLISNLYDGDWPMPLNNILNALELEAGRQLKDIQHATQAEIERIRAQAEAESEIVRQKRLAAIKAPLQAEQARILNKAKLEALQIVLGTREDLITEVLEATARRLAALSNLETYTQLLQMLLQEAVETLEVTGQLHLRVQDQDVALMKHIVQEMKLQAIVDGDLPTEGTWGVDLGGVVVTTADRRVSLINTLEARLRQVTSLYRSKIAELIFNGTVISEL
jgi:vacuolar-type H+-ATPase subunit E/Vma4